MKRQIKPSYIIVLLTAGFILAGCSEPELNENISDEPVIVTSSGGSAAENMASALAPDAIDEEDLSPKIDLSPGSTVIQITNQNLDIDQVEEQIIAYRSKDDASGEIRLLVADYDAIQDAYFPAWESAVAISNAQSFSLAFVDLVGDHVPEILCSGTDAETGEQLLRVYRKSINAQGFGLYFSRIASLSVRGSIQVVEIEREQAYYDGQKNGKSFPIVTNRQDTQSENLSDQIKTTYYWRYQDNAYVEVLEEKIYGERIQDERLNRLFRSGEREFESFLHGPWLRTSQDPSGRLRHNILFFDRRGNHFSLYSGDIQEEYIWQSSNRTNYNQLYLIGVNDLIRFIRKQVSITVRDIDNLFIWTNDANDSWSGEYQRISQDVQAIFYPQNSHERQLPFQLSGVFTNEAGESIIFDEPFFTFRDQEGERKGGYALYQIQNPILELKFLSNAGLVEERKVYKADYLEEEREQEIIRTLVLIPGKVGIRGFVPEENSFVQYEQIEMIDTSED